MRMSVRPPAVAFALLTYLLPFVTGDDLLPLCHSASYPVYAGLQTRGWWKEEICTEFLYKTDFKTET
jgi:hypothetical protein